MQIQVKNLFYSGRMSVCFSPCVSMFWMKERVSERKRKYVGQTVSIECENAIANMLRSWRHDWIFPIKLNIYSVDECSGKPPILNLIALHLMYECDNAPPNDASEWMRLLTNVWPFAFLLSLSLLWQLPALLILSILLRSIKHMLLTAKYALNKARSHDSTFLCKTQN